MTKHTQRFSGRVENYIKYRPTYPLGLVDLLKREANLSPGKAIADIGSGTGILTKLLLDADFSVQAVEPNDEMRVAAEGMLSNYRAFSSIKGSAENTTLGDQSVDFITAAQAFHWFDPELARNEFRRILKTNGVVALIWNNAKSASAYWNEYESFMMKHGTDYRALKESGTESEEKIHSFFRNNFVKYSLSNHQDLDKEGFSGRFLSISHSPKSSDPGFASAMVALDELFQHHQSNGILRIEYDTQVYIGRLDS